MKLREFGGFENLELSYAVDFREYVNQCWKNRYNLYDDRTLFEEEDIPREQQFFNFDGSKIKARNYVGFISFEGESITVYPKIFPKDIKEEHIEGFLMTNLLYWLKRSSKIRLPLIDANMNFAEGETFLEILIHIFSKITLESVYNNPYNNYEEVEEELSYMKGRLNLPEYIKTNLATGRWNYFSTIHEPYIYNNKVNQIIKFVSKTLVSVTQNQESKENLKRILFILDEVEEVHCGENHCSGIKLNRFNKDYETILALCEMFLRNTSITTSKNEGKLNFCFLIPMELLYEEVIYEFLREKFKENFKAIVKQKSNLYLADLQVNDNYAGRFFNLKQDIYLKDLTNQVYILDTKYKVINNDRSRKYGISQSDMYQMCSYAFRGGYNKLALVYPKTFDLEDKLKYVVNSGFGNGVIEINILTVNFLLSYEGYKDGMGYKELWEENDRRLMEDLEECLM